MNDMTLIHIAIGMVSLVCMSLGVRYFVKADKDRIVYIPAIVINGIAAVLNFVVAMLYNS